MRGLESQVSEAQFIKRFKEKLLDLLARKKIDSDDIEFIRKQVEQLFKPEFEGFSADVQQTYKDVMDVVNTLYDDIGPDVSPAFDKVRAVMQTNQLQLQHYQQSTIDGIARVVQQGIIEGISYKELATNISKVGGQASAYADTLAKTQVKRFGRISKYNKSLIADVQYYEYAGILHETIRPFCYACLRKIFRIDKILRMKNGNLEPVIINCGGWNCIHDWEPDPTATAEDAVHGKFYNAPHGVVLYGSSGIAKLFSYSFGLDSIANGEGIKVYIGKCRKKTIKDEYVNHIRRRHGELYGDMSDEALRDKIEIIRSHPDRLYYQHTSKSGPGIVFERGREFVFIGARKIKTMFKPSDYEQYVNNEVKYFRRLRNYE